MLYKKYTKHLYLNLFLFMCTYKIPKLLYNVYISFTKQLHGHLGNDAKNTQPFINQMCVDWVIDWNNIIVSIISI